MSEWVSPFGVPVVPSSIGQFEIGVSPIGTIPPFDWRTTVISQYANSPILIQLIENFFDAVDQTENLDNFFSLIWDINTAVGYGLDVWGRIVGVQRIVPASFGGYFGFEEEGPPQAVGFGQGPFYDGPTPSGNYVLSDDSFRQLILAKALANVCDGSVPAINQVLMTLFPYRGNCYVINSGNMAMTYRFEFALTAVEQAVIWNSGVLPTPAGVAASISIA